MRWNWEKINENCKKGEVSKNLKNQVKIFITKIKDYGVTISSRGKTVFREQYLDTSTEWYDKFENVLRSPTFIFCNQENNFFDVPTVIINLEK